MKKPVVLCQIDSLTNFGTPNHDLIKSLKEQNIDEIYIFDDQLIFNDGNLINKTKQQQYALVLKALEENNIAVKGIVTHAVSKSETLSNNELGQDALNAVKNSTALKKRDYINTKATSLAFARRAPFPMNVISLAEFNDISYLLVIEDKPTQQKLDNQKEEYYSKRKTSEIFIQHTEIDGLRKDSKEDYSKQLINNDDPYIAAVQKIDKHIAKLKAESNSFSFKSSPINKIDALQNLQEKLLNERLKQNPTPITTIITEWENTKFLLKDGGKATFKEVVQQQRNFFTDILNFLLPDILRWTTKTEDFLKKTQQDYKSELSSIKAEEKELLDDDPDMRSSITDDGYLSGSDDESSVSSSSQKP